MCGWDSESINFICDRAFGCVYVPDCLWISLTRICILADDRGGFTPTSEPTFSFRVSHVNEEWLFVISKLDLKIILNVLLESLGLSPHWTLNFLLLLFLLLSTIISFLLGWCKNRKSPRVWTFLDFLFLAVYFFMISHIDGDRRWPAWRWPVALCWSWSWPLMCPMPIRVLVPQLNKSQRRRASKNSEVFTKYPRSERRKKNFSRVLKLSFWKFTGSVV